MVSKHLKKEDGRFVAMAIKHSQILNLKFNQVMFNSLIFTWERNFEVTFGIFSVSVTQINVLESYFRYLSVLKLVRIKKCEDCDNLGL